MKRHQESVAVIDPSSCFLATRTRAKRCVDVHELQMVSEISE